MNINEIIDNIHQIPQASKTLLLSYVSEIDYPKGFHLFREGVSGSKCYFIKKGMVRTYTYNRDKEVTFWFGKEGDIIFPLQTLHTGQEEYANVELLEDTFLYEINLDTLQKLYLTDNYIANWGRKYVEYACIKSEKQFISRQFKTSLQRYKELIEEFPNITQRVSLNIIASYLGISQVNLSRVRAKMR